MRKAVFFDIDGTLWDFYNQIPESTVSAIRTLRKNGHYAFICSGRARAYIQHPDLFAIGFAFGIPVLKWLLRWKKEKRLREEAQKAENPEKPQEPVTNDEKSA